jgi:hypothetical protein
MVGKAFLAGCRCSGSYLDGAAPGFDAHQITILDIEFCGV